MTKAEQVKKVVESFGDNFDVEYTAELMELYEITPIELAVAQSIDNTMFDVVQLVKVAMEYSYEQCHAVHGY